MSNITLPRRIDPLPSETLFRKALRTQGQVLWALMLHDIKSRFFGNGFGYFLTILWPAAHVAIIMALFVIGKRPVPYGSSALLYASTGILPYIAWNYISRFTMLTMVMNKSFLSYSIVRPLDMMFARIFLEHITIFIVTVALLTVCALCQVDITPIRLGDALFGLLSAILLGIGFGVLNSVIVMFFHFWFIGYVGILLLFWFTAGLAINPEAMPHQIGYWISWNPLLHSVEWIRLGYYPDFPAHLLSRGYVLACGAGSLALGLIMERICRRFF